MRCEARTVCNSEWATQVDFPELHASCRLAAVTNTSDGTGGSPIRDFHAAASAFRAWIYTGTDRGEAAVRMAMLHLSSLLRLATKLQPTDVCSEGQEFPTRSDCRMERARLCETLAARLPFQCYWAAIRPLAIYDSGEVGVGDILDDLLDILGDLEDGMELLEKGEVSDALMHWTLLFRVHWGTHATEALVALQAFLSDPESVPKLPTESA